jgi:hypothetical protein
VQQSFATGANPYSAIASDINGDGQPDVVAANYSDNTVSVLFNATAIGSFAPSFASQQTFATGSGPVSVATTDLNGDGLKDLIVANQHDNNVSVLLGTTPPGSGVPGFASQQVFAAGSTPQSVATADLNGDGLQDLIVSNYVDNGTVSVLLNTTTPGATAPSFATAQPFVAGAFPTYAAVADVNGDGVPDLVVTNQNDNTVSVLINTTGPGAVVASFATQQSFPVGASPSFVSVADINADGKPDLLVANLIDGTVSVLINSTVPGALTPGFTAQQTFAAGAFSYTVTAVDVDGDGKPDLMVSNYLDNSVTVLRNTTLPGAATASFAAPQTSGTGADPASIAAADLNGDGKPDLLVANSQGGSVSVLLNTQFQAVVTGSPATGTIVHDYIFVDGFE